MEVPKFNNPNSPLANLHHQLVHPRNAMSEPSSAGNSQQHPAPSSDGSTAIPDADLHAPLFTLSASTVLSTLPTSATTILDHYAQSPIPAGLLPPQGKVTIKVRPIGSTPPLKQSVYKISASQPFHVLVRFIAKQLNKTKGRPAVQGQGPGESLFCYVNTSFSPALDEPLGNLYANFAVDGNLQVSYCYTVAFG